MRSGECDVAVGSRFVSGDGYAPYRYRPSPARRFGTGLLRRSVGVVLRRPFRDATSGLYAVNAKALPLLAEPYTSGAPEVEALIRVVDAGLRLEEVPVDMAPSAGGESKLRGGKAVKLVVTVAAALVAALVARHRRSADRGSGISYHRGRCGAALEPRDCGAVRVVRRRGRAASRLQPCVVGCGIVAGPPALARLARRRPK